MKTEVLLRTPLFDAHVRRGAKMDPFAGWEMPVQYTGVIPEHRAVRSAAGLFDVSHMGEVFVEGPEAELALNEITCNDVTALYDGKAQYSALCTEQGGVVDDIIVYRFNPTKYLVCVNASNADRDFAWLKAKNRRDAVITNRSSEYGQIAIQGPCAVEIATRIPELKPCEVLTSFEFRTVQWRGGELIVARTGYTGEDGFEVFVPLAQTEALWNLLLEVGEPSGLVPVGLGARDTLRLEACLPLHGHELSEEISAIESGLGWIVKEKKGAFIGSAVLTEQKRVGTPRKLVGFVLDEAGIARHLDPIVDQGGAPIGFVTSGTKTPTVDKALGMALVDSAHAEIGSKLYVQVRGRTIATSVVKRPFYKAARRTT